METRSIIRCACCKHEIGILYQKEIADGEVIDESEMFSNYAGYVGEAIYCDDCYEQALEEYEAYLAQEEG